MQSDFNIQALKAGILQKWQGKISDESLQLLRIELAKTNDIETLTALHTMTLKSPRIGLILGLLLGGFAADRFYKGDVLLGFIKIALVFFEGIGFIWVLLDWFLVRRGIRQDNFMKINNEFLLHAELDYLQAQTYKSHKKTKMPPPLQDILKHAHELQNDTKTYLDKSKSLTHNRFYEGEKVYIQIMNTIEKTKQETQNTMQKLNSYLEPINFNKLNESQKEKVIQTSNDFIHKLESLHDASFELYECLNDSKEIDVAHDSLQNSLHAAIELLQTLNKTIK